MRHLLLATAMFVLGLAITLGTASVLHDVAVIRGKSVQSDGFELGQMTNLTMKPSMQGRSPAADTPYDSHF
jgi:hypothetical protein